VKNNEAFKQNRKVVGQVITAVCFLGSQGLAFKGHDESRHLLIKKITLRF
jgi:hypothetical protein